MAEIKGGDKFASALRDIAKGLASASSIEVGFLENGRVEPDGTPVALVAAIQEFGAPSRHIPPRPFFRTMISEHQDEWPKEIARLLKANNYDAARTLAGVGAGIKGQLQQSIADTSDPPLSPITVMLRGMRTQARYRDMPFWERFAEAKRRVAAGKTSYGASTEPLVDSGNMLNSVDFKVE